tara:strand:- start:836 stop:1057 length:222 start_codon:yes stop_codon:yes gene_type:complete
MAGNPTKRTLLVSRFRPQSPYKKTVVKFTWDDDAGFREAASIIGRGCSLKNRKSNQQRHYMIILWFKLHSDGA